MKKLILYCIIIFLVSCSSSEVNEWRGKNRNGIYEETNLLKQWPESGLEETLLIENIGNGYGSPIVSDKYIYVSGEIDSSAILFCFDHNGKQVWKSAFGKDWTKNFPGSRSTPTLSGNSLFILSGMGNLYCINARNGKIKWHRNSSEYEAISPVFGFSESILCDKDKVYWVAGGPEKNIVALDRKNGKTIWSQKAFGEPSAYNSPRFIDTPVGKQIILFTAYHIMGIDAETGELKWSQEQTSYPPEKRKPGMGDTHANTPIYSNGSLYYIAGDGNGGVRLDINENGDHFSEKWRNENLDGYMGGMVLMNDVLYACGTRKKELKAIDPESGDVVHALKIGSGSVIGSNDILYYYNHRGEMMLISVDSGKMEVISKFKITKGTKEHFAHPVIKNGLLYVRHGQCLMAYDIGNKG